MNSSQQISALVKRAAESQGIKISDLLVECGLNKNSLSSMNAGSMPKADTLFKIASRLGCTMDYLMTGTQKEMPIIIDDEHRDNIKFLYEALCKIPESKYDAAIIVLEAMAK